MGGDRRSFRVIDTGIRSGRRNMALDQALIEARGRGEAPDTIRFLRFRPAALIGRHQFLGHEVDADYCRAHGIEIGRRITGGGALYLDPGQIGWELVFDRASLGLGDLGEAARRICEAAAAGLRRLGVAACYRPRNDIEVDGRKIGGTGGFFDGSTLFYQGTLLIDFDPAEMMRVLTIPAAKQAKHGLASAHQRIVTMRELLGPALPDLATIYDGLLAGFADGLGLAPHWGEVSPQEEALADRLYEEIGSDEFVSMLDAPASDGALASATIVRPGGTLRVDIRRDGPGLRRIREILITGDFFVTPPRIILDLEADLRGREDAEAGPAIEAFFARTPVELLSLTPADLRTAVEAALRSTGG